MKLNINKSSVMLFTPKTSQNISCLVIFMDGNKLQEVDHQKYLGIMFDKRLRWDHHVNDVCRHYLQLLSIHRKSSESLIFSRITYALPMWGPPL